jgi:hypothetical protein
MSIENEARRNAQIEAEANSVGLPAWQLEAARSVPTDLVRDIVNDHRRGVHQVSSPLGKPADPRAVMEPVGAVTFGPANRGWVEAPPLPDSPPGDWAIQRMIDEQNARDRAERVAALAKAGLLKPNGGEDGKS